MGQPLQGGHVTKHRSSPLHRSSPTYLPTHINQGNLSPEDRYVHDVACSREGFVEVLKLPFICSIPGATQHEQVPEREFFIDNLLVRVHRCFWCTGLAPWEFESPFPGSLISTFLEAGSTLEATQGKIDGFFSQLPYKCRQNRVASVGDWLVICPWVASRVASSARGNLRISSSLLV